MFKNITFLAKVSRRRDVLRFFPKTTKPTHALQKLSKSSDIQSHVYADVHPSTWPSYISPHHKPHYTSPHQASSRDPLLPCQRRGHWGTWTNCEKLVALEPKDFYIEKAIKKVLHFCAATLTAWNSQVWLCCFQSLPGCTNATEMFVSLTQLREAEVVRFVGTERGGDMEPPFNTRNCESIYTRDIWWV